MIHKVNRPSDNVIIIGKEIVWFAPLQIPEFNVDNKTVLILLKELCNGTNIDTCINGIQCGRTAM